MADRAQQHLQQGPAVVQLNVGGTLFQTSKDTLLKASGGQAVGRGRVPGLAV